MKNQAKRIKSLGRKYAKQAFHLTENDFVELSMLERAYLNGYRRAIKEVEEIGEVDILGGIQVTHPISDRTIQQIVETLKDNLIPEIHHDIDIEAFNKDYEGLLQHLKAVEYIIKVFRVQLEFAVKEKNVK